jgi:hypothetical protein
MQTIKNKNKNSNKPSFAPHEKTQVSWVQVALPH